MDYAQKSLVRANEMNQAQKTLLRQIDIAKDKVFNMRKRLLRKARRIAIKNEMLKQFIPIFRNLSYKDLKTLVAACRIAEVKEHPRFSPPRKLGLSILNKKERRVYAKALEHLMRYNETIEGMNV